MCEWSGWRERVKENIEYKTRLLILMTFDTNVWDELVIGRINECDETV